MESGDLVAVHVWLTAAKENQSMDMGGIDLFEVKGAKITQVCGKGKGVCQRY